MNDGSWGPTTESFYRDRSLTENIIDFQRMIDGKYKEGHCCLRMKMDPHSDNPNMRDHVAYRIIYKSHPRTGDIWCIYPSYDYSHCLIDSLEKITHSMCSMEFQTRNESYS